MSKYEDDRQDEETFWNLVFFFLVGVYFYYR